MNFHIMENSYDVTIHKQFWILEMYDMQYKTPRPASQVGAFL